MFCMFSVSDRHGGIPWGSHWPILQLPAADSHLPTGWQLWSTKGWRGRVWTQQSELNHKKHMINWFMSIIWRWLYLNTTWWWLFFVLLSGLSHPRSTLQPWLLVSCQRIPVIGVQSGHWISGWKNKAFLDYKVRKLFEWTKSNMKWINVHLTLCILV